MQFAVDERFVLSVNNPGEESGRTKRHLVDASSAHAALSIHAIATGARVLGMTERADGSLGGTAWRGERLFRLHVIQLTDEEGALLAPAGESAASGESAGIGDRARNDEGAG